METQSQQLATKDHDFTEQYLKSEHGELIEGINNLYNTFIAMGYFDSSELRFPPHLDLDVDTLASIGLEAEAIALLRYLPYADSEVEISTWTMCGIMTTAKRPTTKQTETDGEGIELLLFCLLI